MVDDYERITTHETTTERPVAPRRATVVEQPVESDTVVERKSQAQPSFIVLVLRDLPPVLGQHLFPGQSGLAQSLVESGRPLRSAGNRP